MIFDLFKKAPKPEEPVLTSSALIEDRPVEKKIEDYQQDEIVASASEVGWREKTLLEFRKFPIFDQNGSGSCVAQTAAKMMGITFTNQFITDLMFKPEDFFKLSVVEQQQFIVYLNESIQENYVHFSATHIYKRRRNRPGGGMFAQDALSIPQRGVTLEVFAPSQGMRDSQMDAMGIKNYAIEVGDIFKIRNYVELPTRSMERVASTIQHTGKGVMVWFYFTRDEWTNTPVVLNDELELRGANTVRHSVTAVDFAIVNGVPGLIVEDSWGKQYGWGGQRFISEEFFAKRNFFSGYLMNFDFEEEKENPELPDPSKPKYRFTKDMKFSTRVSYGDAEVIALQDCLKYLGMFPTNTDSTGYFGAITKKGVIKFQASRNLVQDGIVGRNTREELNRIFA